jgi:transaldolase
VPGTEEGFPAIEQLTAAGVNVNVTLLFSIDHYERAALAYQRGLAALDDPSRVASVASFFVSRVDTHTDRHLEELDSPEAGKLMGRAAIANARLAYRLFTRLFGEPFADLAARGARRQRVLWGSTSTKNPSYSDVRYVEELIGPDTVNTAPPATLDAFRDHGQVRGDTVLEDVDEAERVFAELADIGIEFDEVTDRLLREGVQAFADSYDDLLAALDERAG